MNNLEEEIDDNTKSSEISSQETSLIDGDVEMSPTNDDIALHFINTCGIICSSMVGLSGIVIYRDVLLCDHTYQKLKKDIPKLKSLLSSTIYTSMQKDAAKSQQWPLLNLIRQILKKYNYNLVPKRVCDGYTKDGVKKYKRLFEIKAKSLTNPEI